MRRDREQFWLVAACVIALHAVALAVTTLVWVFAIAREAPSQKKIEIAAADPIVRLDPPPVEPEALGEVNGVGEANLSVDQPNKTVSDKPSDVEQAWTRKQPVPLPSRVSPQPKAEPPSGQPESSLGPQSVTAMSPLAVKVPPVKSPDEALREKPSEERPLEKKSPEQAAEQAAEAEATTPQAKAPVDPTPPAEEAAKSDVQPDPANANPSESDAFAKDEGADFTPGGTVARRGREVKLQRPRIDLGFMAEATRISGRDLVVRMSIATDGVGNPSRVTVLDSSGSEVIDDAVRLAMYDSWFGGKMPDSFVFTVRFVRR